jgi:hypothetical protein
MAVTLERPGPRNLNPLTVLCHAVAQACHAFLGEGRT